MGSAKTQTAATHKETSNSNVSPLPIWLMCRREQQCVLPWATISVNAWVWGLISPTKTSHCHAKSERKHRRWQVWLEAAVCVLETERCFFFHLPPAWRGEPLCGAYWDLKGAPGAHRAADCQPGRELEEHGGPGSPAGTSWRDNVYR